jgi:hypothetical protein
MAEDQNMVGVAAQQALQDMVELEMYLVAQPQQAPWPMLPRRTRKDHGVRNPQTNPVASSAANELIDREFLEATSSHTFVVSKSGYQFYQREMKPRFG